MKTKAFWLLSLTLLAGCESPAEQAKSAKYEKLYREAGETVEAVEHALSITEDNLGKSLRQLKAAREELQHEREQREVAEQERDRLDGEIAKLKETIEQLQGELQEARTAKTGGAAKKDESKKDDAKQEAEAKKEEPKKAESP